MRARQLIKVVLLSVVSAAATLLSFSCSGGRTDGTCVVVLHSYDRLGGDGDIYVKDMAKRFRKLGRNPEIHHIYANLLNQDQSTFWFREWVNGGLRDSVIMWKPDLILSNDDPALDFALNIGDSLFKAVPSVFAGVNFPDEERLEKFPLMTGFRDKPALSENIELVRKVGSASSVVVPLDRLPFDSNMYNALSAAVRSNPSYSMSIALPKAGAAEPDGFHIHIVSMLHPAGNVPGMEDWREAERLTSEFVANADRYRFLQVKKDAFSDFLPQSSGRAQFTAIREGFSDNAHRYLCGYFTGLDLQIEDLVKCSNKILNGADVSAMIVRDHAKKYYLDYEAYLADYGSEPKASEWAGFEIVAQPFASRHKFIFALILVVILLLLALFVFRPDLERRRQSAVDEELRANLLEAQVKRKVLHDNGMFIWRFSEGRFHFFPAFRKFTGMEKPSISFSDFCRTCVHPDDMGKINQIKENIRHPGSYKLTVELTFNGGADWHWWDIYYESRADADKYNHGLIVLADDAVAVETDITRAASISSEALLKENFLANISHDIRTPLSAVTGFAELMTEPDLTPEDAEEYSSIIKSNSESLLRLIEDVAARSELEDNELSLNMEKIRISDIVRNCYRSNKVLVPSSLKFIYEPCESGPGVKVEADALRITQVVNNFLSNSFKFTASGFVKLGWISDPEAGEVEVYVEDSGSGIEPSMLPQVFQRYVKSKESVKGTGLGLSICKDIIENHGGTIKAQSEPLKGSRFSFRLPIYVETA